MRKVKNQPATMKTRVLRIALSIACATAAVGFGTLQIPMADAREVASGATGGGGGGTTTCLPIKSFKAAGDAKIGDIFGTGNVAIDYSVQPCDTTKPVVVTIQVIKYSTGEVVYQYDDAPLSGKVTYAGAAYRSLYTAKAIVTDAATGAILDSKSITVAIPAPKV